MLSSDTVIYNYQNYLLNKLGRYDFEFNDPDEDVEEEGKSKESLKILRFVIEELLEWTPEQARDHFGEKEIKTFRLDAILKKVKYPRAIRRRDYQYLISLAYPERIKYDASVGIIKQWEYIKSHPGTRFAGNLFIGEDGMEKAYALLNEFNRINIPVSSVRELYEAYADSSYINNLLREEKLFTSLSKLYTYPISFLHEMIKFYYPGEEDEYLYSVYLYNNVENSISSKDLI